MVQARAEVLAKTNRIFESTGAPCTWRLLACAAEFHCEQGMGDDLKGESVEQAWQAAMRALAALDTMAIGIASTCRGGGPEVEVAMEQAWPNGPMARVQVTMEHASPGISKILHISEIREADQQAGQIETDPEDGSDTYVGRAWRKGVIVQVGKPIPPYYYKHCVGLYMQSVLIM